jgi:hypothetical protein
MRPHRGEEEEVGGQQRLKMVRNDGQIKNIKLSVKGFFPYFTCYGCAPSNGD